MWKDFKAEIKQQAYVDVKRLQVRNQTTILCLCEKTSGQKSNNNPIELWKAFKSEIKQQSYVDVKRL